MKKHVLLICKDYKESDGIGEIFSGKGKTLIFRTIGKEVCDTAQKLDIETVILVDLDMASKEVAYQLIFDIQALPESVNIVATTTKPKSIPRGLRNLFTMFKEC